MSRRKTPARLLSVLATLTTITVPGSAMLLAPAAIEQPAPPVGVAAWTADDRELPDPVTADPLEIHRWFAGLDPATADALAVRHPGVVGNLDGAPPALRYAANSRAMEEAGEPYRGRTGQILLFDPRGMGRIAQVFGSLETADRIAVLVPGAGNRGGNFFTGVGGKDFRSPSVQGSALYDAATASGRAAGRLAVVVWLGYDPPRSVDLVAAREDRARTGAAALVRFARGLTAERPRATIALIGYSYGSTVIGVAAHQLPAQVTDIAAIGSPGMGVDRAVQLGTEARLWAGLSVNDKMRFVPGIRILGLGHGRQPADPAFGATVISTSDVIDHDHYLHPGTDSLDHLAAIASAGDDLRAR